MKKFVLPALLLASCFAFGSCSKTPTKPGNSLGDAESGCDCCSNCQVTDPSQQQSCGCCDQCGTDQQQY